MSIRCGDTLLFQTPPVIAAGAAVGGKKEGEGPLAAEFDELSADNRFGQSSWEAAETYLQLRAARLCLQKAALPQEKVQLALAGDLQAQCTASSYALRACPLPGCSGPAAPWPRGWRWGLPCARAVRPGRCWLWRPATSARQNGSSARP